MSSHETDRTREDGTGSAVHDYIHSWRFWVLVGYVLIVVVFGICWIWMLFGPVDRTLRDEQMSKLTSIGQSGAIALSETEETPDALAEALVSGSDLRVTVISSTGAVLGDSAHDPSTMDDHGQRPEVVAALSGSTGSDTRVSATEGIPRIYVAVPATYQGGNVALRVSEPESDAIVLTHRLRVTGLVIMLVGVAIAALIAWRSLRSASQPVRNLDRVRSDFVANASHELKTPVAGIRLLSETIEGACEDGDLETTRKFAVRLDDEAQRLQHLVVDLLDLSRLESEQVDRSRTDFHAAVSTSFEAHRKMVHEKRLLFIFDDQIDSDTLCYVRMNASDASLIIDNLLDNATHYTEQGFIQVKLGTTDDEVVLQVIDSGIGIPAADQARVFERFYRVDTNRSRESGGTGLGLSLVRHAVKRGNGTIEVESAPGEGSTFTVRLPLVK
ncbi:MAG: ATP-binding protein [Coriobacteriales bacterium]